MNYLDRRVKNNIFFNVVVLLILFVMLQGQVNKLYAEAIQPAEKTTVYPSTPEAVVENEHKNQYDRNFKGKPYYFLRESYCEADCGIIVNSYTVKKLTQSDDKARIMVEFDVVGTFSLGYVTEKDDHGYTLEKTKADECNDFDLFKTTSGEFDYGVIYYDLVREEGKWKIVPHWKGCFIEYMSIDTAINLIEDKMKSIKGDSIKTRNLKIIDFLRNLKKPHK